MVFIEADSSERSKSFSEKEEGKNNVQLNNVEAEQGNTKLKEVSAILSLKSLAKTC